MNVPVDRRRRQLLLGMLAAPVAGAVRAAMPTPGGTEGPFYPLPAMRYADDDSDLVRIADEVELAGGEIVRLAGRVLDRDGRPLAGAQVEIWQCDANGVYLHRRDPNHDFRDRAFQGFGRSSTGADGDYAFRTIKPVPYPGRTPHIHVKVWHDGRERLTTQFYLPDHPQNARDWLYNRIPRDRLEQVTLRFGGADPEPLARLDIVI